MDEKKLQEQLETLEKNIKSAATAEAKAEIEKEIKAVKEAISKIDTKSITESVESLKNELKEVKEAKVKMDEADRKAFDQLLVDVKDIKGNVKGKEGKKTFSQLFAAEVEKNFDDIQKVSKGKKCVIEMKAVGDMTIAANLTGDGTPTYGQSPILLPGQMLNFRDLMPTTVSPTRTYIQHREKTTGEGAPAAQTEGSAKAQIDVDFEEVKTVNEYVAGFTRYSKQIAKEISFFTQTLPRVLLRKFYTAENSKFWTDVVGTSGISTAFGSATDDVQALIDAIAYQMNDNYNASYALVNPLQLARLNKLLYASGNNFQGQGGVVSVANGSITIAGVPIYSAPWVVDDKCLIIDNAYLERVEAEGITVEFFEQDSDNVQKNMITARIECFEKVNLMLPASARYFDFGNAS